MLFAIIFAALMGSAYNNVQNPKPSEPTAAERAQTQLNLYTNEKGQHQLIHPNEAKRIVIRDGVTYIE